ncbi:unnamed protein product, partial [Iphiclides podalirius]
MPIADASADRSINLRVRLYCGEYANWQHIIALPLLFHTRALGAASYGHVSYLLVTRGLSHSRLRRGGQFLAAPDQIKTRTAPAESTASHLTRSTYAHSN